MKACLPAETGMWVLPTFYSSAQTLNTPDALQRLRRLWCPHHGMLLLATERKKLDICNNLGESPENSIKRKQSNLKRLHTAGLHSQKNTSFGDGEPISGGRDMWELRSNGAVLVLGCGSDQGSYTWYSSTEVHEHTHVVNAKDLPSRVFFFKFLWYYDNFKQV